VEPTKRARRIGGTISVAASLVFVMSAAMKLIGGPELAQGMEHLQLATPMTIPLAILELSCVAVYLIPQTSVLGAVLLTGYLGGAILTHWRVGDLFVTHLVLGALIWLGIYLREPRLKQLLPVRTRQPRGVLQDSSKFAADSATPGAR
jgi:DoxX-like family